MKTTARMKTLAVLAVIAVLLTGCAGPEEPTRFDMEIPSGGKELEAWATKVAEDNSIETEYGASTIARTICSDLLPKHDELIEVGMEVAGFRGVDARESSDLIAIAIYGYCPQYASRWENDDRFKKRDVKGVTPLIWK
jgi:hypothetical protein